MKMRMKKRISDAAEFLRKAVRALRGKAGVLRARLLFLASVRRRTAMVGAVSRHLRALMSRSGRQREAAAAALAPSTAEEQVPQPAALHGVDVAGLSELLQEVVDDDDDGGCYPDWTHSLFDDDDDGGCYPDWTHSLIDDGDEGHRSDGEDLDNDEPSVIDVIRNRREEDGLEFNVEEEIDHAADMFIRRVRNRMRASS